METETPCPSKEYPAKLCRVQYLVRCEDMRDFVDLERQRRKSRMPYWTYYPEDDLLVFDFVDNKTNRKELEASIKAGRVYIRECDAESEATRANVGIQDAEIAVGK